MRLEVVFHRGAEQRVVVRDAAAEGDVARVVGEQDGAQQHAQVAAQFVEEGQGLGVAGAGRFRGRAAVPAGCVEEMTAAVVLDHGIAVNQAAELAGAAVGAVQQAAFHHDTHPDSRSQGHGDEQFRLLRGGIESVDAERVTVRIVVHRHGHVEPVFQISLERNLFPGRNVLRVVDDALVDIDHGRNADTYFISIARDDAVDQSAEVVERLLQGGVLREGRCRERVLDDPILHQSETQIGPSNVYSERHCNEFLQIYEQNGKALVKFAYFKEQFADTFSFLKKNVHLCIKPKPHVTTSDNF